MSYLSIILHTIHSVLRSLAFTGSPMNVKLHQPVDPIQRSSLQHCKEKVFISNSHNFCYQASLQTETAISSLLCDLQFIACCHATPDHPQWYITAIHQN